MKSFAVPLVLVALAGCATTASHSSACLDARRSVDVVSVESPTSVVVRQAPSRQYRLTLSHECPALTQRSVSISLSNGMSRSVFLPGGQEVWATQIHGSGKMCGGGLDKLVVRKFGDDLSMPPRTCAIKSVEPL